MILWAYQLKKGVRIYSNSNCSMPFLTVGLFVASPQQVKLSHYLLVGYPLLSLMQTKAFQDNLNLLKISNETTAIMYQDNLVSLTS